MLLTLTTTHQPATEFGSSGRESAHDPLTGNESQLTSVATAQGIEARRSSSETSLLALEARPEFFDDEAAADCPEHAWEQGQDQSGANR